MKIAAIIPAAGKGKRLKAGKSKPFVSVLGRPLLAHTLLRLKSAFSFTEIILAADASQIENVKNILKSFGVSKARVVIGGRTRAESVKNALWNVSKACDFVLVHDAARPLISAAIVKQLIKEAQRNGAAICALPVSSTVKKIDKKKGVVLGTEDRSCLYLAQTPQVFKKDLLVERYQKLGKKALEATDEAALFDGSGISVRIVEGEARNIKITTREDIDLMKFYLKRKSR